MRIWLLVFLVLVACKSQPLTPAEPVLGKTTCAQCNMTLNDLRAASQSLSDGSRKFFDDIGCLAEWLEQSGGKPDAAWVRSPDGSAWVDAFAAHYSAGHATPMGYGFLSADEGLNFREFRLVAREKPKKKR